MRGKRITEDARLWRGEIVYRHLAEEWVRQGCQRTMVFTDDFRDAADQRLAQVRAAIVAWQEAGLHCSHRVQRLLFLDEIEYMTVAAAEPLNLTVPAQLQQALSKAQAARKPNRRWLLSSKATCSSSLSGSGTPWRS